MAGRDRQAQTRARIVIPGPINPVVLILQERHISQTVWNRTGQNWVSLYGQMS